MAQLRMSSMMSAFGVVVVLFGGSLATAQAQSSEAQRTEVLRTITSSNGISDSHASNDGAKVVVFGDSHTTGTNAPYRIDERGCLKGTASWPDQLQEKLGLIDEEFIDVSCSGASINSQGLHFSDQVRDAEERGALGEGTEQIIVQLGKNDSWGDSTIVMRGAAVNCLLDRVAGCGDEAIAAGTVQNPAAVTGENYAARIKPVIDYVKYYAPNAEITLMGYQDFLSRSGGEICAKLLGAVDIVKSDAFAMVSYMNNLDTAIRSAAAALEINYADLREATAGHGSCSEDPWINGILDPRADLIGAPWHPSTRGDTAAADLLFSQISAA